MDWQTIETAPRNRSVTVSMRDVDRQPPVWRAHVEESSVQGRWSLFAAVVASLFLD